MNRTRTRVNLPVPLLARSALFSGAYPTLDSVRRENSRRMLRFGITSGSICVDTQPCGVPTRLEYRNSAMFKVPGPFRALCGLELSLLDEAPTLARARGDLSAGLHHCVARS